MPRLTTAEIARAQARSFKPCLRGHETPRNKHGNCPDCQKIRGERHRATRHSIRQTMLRSARDRARKGGYACTITVADIAVPEFCPLLGMRLERNTGTRSSSPSLDKIRPELGYVPGNVWVISHRANTLKSDATLRELQKLVDNLAKTYVNFPWEPA